MAVEQKCPPAARHDTDLELPMVFSSRTSPFCILKPRLAGLALLCTALACNPDGATTPDRNVRPAGAALGKAPAGPTVTSATPDSGAQGTTLDVHIRGSGFTSGAVATWQLGGVANPNQVRTNATTVVSDNELVANITIADTASVASWDVQVALVGGKKGIGTELFAITKGRPNDVGTSTGPSGARWVFGSQGTTIDAAGVATPHAAGVYGDGLDVNGVSMGGSPTADPFVGTSSGDYQDGLCGLALRVYWWNRTDATGDGTLDPTLNTASTCPARRYRVTLGSSVVPVWGFINAFQIMQLPLNGSRRQIFRMRIEQPNCTRLVFGTSASETDINATSGGVRITRVVGTTPSTHELTEAPGYVPGEWLVESVDGVGACEVIGKGQRWVRTAVYQGLYFRIHIAEIPPTI